MRVQDRHKPWLKSKLATHPRTLAVHRNRTLPARIQKTVRRMAAKVKHIHLPPGVAILYEPPRYHGGGSLPLCPPFALSGAREEGKRSLCGTTTRRRSSLAHLADSGRSACMPAWDSLLGCLEFLQKCHNYGGHFSNSFDIRKPTLGGPSLH